jgi:hypothetical protein
MPGKFRFVVAQPLAVGQDDPKVAALRPDTNPITLSRRFGSRRYRGSGPNDELNRWGEIRPKRFRRRLAPALRRTSNGQSRFRGAPGAQLLGLRLFGVLEIVVGLDEEKPGTLPVTDCMCLLQAIFCLSPPQIDASHQAIPRCSHVPHCSRQSWQNVGSLPNGENLGMPAATRCVHYPTQSPLTIRDARDACSCVAVCSLHVERPTAFKAGKSRPAIFGFSLRRRLAAGQRYGKGRALPYPG